MVTTEKIERFYTMAPNTVCFGCIDDTVSE